MQGYVRYPGHAEDHDVQDVTDVQLLQIALQHVLVIPEFSVAADGRPGTVREGKDKDDDIEKLKDASPGGTARLKASDADIFDNDREHAEEEAAHDGIEVVLQVAQVLWVEHLAQSVDQLTQVEVVGGTRKGCKDTY